MGKGGLYIITIIIVFITTITTIIIVNLHASLVALSMQEFCNMKNEFNFFKV